MDKSYFTNSDQFVSPYLRRRLRPLSEVVTVEKRPGSRGNPIKGEKTPGYGAGSPAAVVSPSDNERDG